MWVGDALYGVEIGSILSVVSDASRIRPIPVVRPGLLGISTYHDSPTPIFDLATCFGAESQSTTRTELIQTLIAREKDHEDWLWALEESVKNNVPFLKAKDPHQCAFGKWYDTFQTRDEMLAEILKKFDAPHKHIHSLAEKLLLLRDQGKIASALEIINHERIKTLAELKKLFHLARTRIRESIQPVVLYLTRDGETPVLGLLVDEVNDVVTMEEEDIISAEHLDVLSQGDGGKLLKGYVKTGTKSDYFVFDPFRILDSEADISTLV